MARKSISSRPAQSAGFSFRSHALLGRTTLAVLLGGFALACNDTKGIYAHYQLEKRFFRAQQQWEKAQLPSAAGGSESASLWKPEFEAALAEFQAMRPTLSLSDTVLFEYAAQAAFELSDEYGLRNLWHDAARSQELVAFDSLFPVPLRHRALFGLGDAYERLGQPVQACDVLRRLADSFFPPLTEGGVNYNVLQVPNRRVSLAQHDLPDSLPAFRAYAQKYYDSLATAFPQSELGFQALGELGKCFGQMGQWDMAIATLKRATDSTGAVFPSYRVDIGEIQAGQMHDTTQALAVFEDVARSLATTPFRVDADLKTAAIWFVRGDYARVQSLLSDTKKQFADQGNAILGVEPLLARSYEAAGDHVRARAEFSYLVTTFPRTLQAVEAAVAVAQQYLQSKDSSSANEWFNRADQLATDLAADGNAPPEVRGTALNVRASLAVQYKRWDDAIARLTDIVQNFSTGTALGSGALVRLGWLELNQRHDTLAAASAWQAFLTAHPNHPEGEPLRTEMNKWPERFRTNATS